jgi:hypothetical protein
VHPALKFVVFTVGAATSAILGVVPPDDVMFVDAVTDVTHVAHEMAGVAPPEDAIGPVPVTAVTVPPLDGDVFVTVRKGQVPVIEMPVPAVSEGVAEPVPPFATGRMPVKVILGVTPPVEASTPPAVTVVTGAVIRAASGMDVSVKFVPEIAGAAARAMFGVVPPEEVRLGPVAVTEVTVPPEEGAVFVTVRKGHVPVIEIPVPAVSEGAALPVPPLAIGTMPVRLIFGVAPPLEAKGADAETLETNPLPTHAPNPMERSA